MTRLWGIINGEPYLLNGEKISIPHGKPLFFAKLFVFCDGKESLMLANPPRPFNLLRDSEYIDLADLCRYRKCHARTITRHVSSGNLKAKKKGHEWYFRVGAIRDWEKAVPEIAIGRPRKEIGRHQKKSRQKEG